MSLFQASRQALAEAHSIDEVKDIRDKAEAIRLYAQKAKDRELVWWAAELKLGAERKAGGILQQKIEAGELVQHQPPKGYQGDTLSDYGLSKLESSRWQISHAVDETTYQAWKSRLKGDAIPTSSAPGASMARGPGQAVLVGKSCPESGQ